MKKRRTVKAMLLVASALFVMSSSCFAGDLPDPVRTPGAINPDVTQANVQSTVCVRGWSKTGRPPVSHPSHIPFA